MGHGPLSISLRAGFWLTPTVYSYEKRFGLNQELSRNITPAVSS